MIDIRNDTWNNHGPAFGDMRLGVHRFGKHLIDQSPQHSREYESMGWGDTVPIRPSDKTAGNELCDLANARTGTFRFEFPRDGGFSWQPHLGA